MTEFGDTVYEAGNDTDDDATYATDSDDTLLDVDTDEAEQTDWQPPERAPQNTRFGMTEAEELEGESLDQRLAEEEPDVFDSADVDETVEPRAGRLVAPDEGAHEDEEADLVANDVGTAGYAATAEEAAMHVVEEDSLDDR